MQIIDLIYRKNGNLDYEIIHFPDGQHHLRITSEINRKEAKTIIKCRIRNADDLFLLIQALDIMNRHGIKPDVHIYYLMGARMDRIMSFNEPFTLQIIANVLNGFNARFSILEPHNKDVIKEFNFIDKQRILPTHMVNDFIYCFPDEGAIRRYADGICYSKPFIYFEKRRDSFTGELSEFQLYASIDITGKDVYVIDDLIDDGRTFCGIAPFLREKNPNSITLNVCHAIQLEGIKRVADVYDRVVITNSYDSWDLEEDLPDNVEVVDILHGWEWKENHYIRCSRVELV